MFNKFITIQISPIYQSIHMFEPEVCSLGAPDASLFEHFLPWIQKIMLAYEIKSTDEKDLFPPEGTIFSKGYYTRKVN